MRHSCCLTVLLNVIPTCKSCFSVKVKGNKQESGYRSASSDEVGLKKTLSLSLKQHCRGNQGGVSMFTVQMVFSSILTTGAFRFGSSGCTFHETGFSLLFSKVSKLLLRVYV